MCFGAILKTNPLSLQVSRRLDLWTSYNLHIVVATSQRRNDIDRRLRRGSNGNQSGADTHHTSTGNHPIHGDLPGDGVLHTNVQSFFLKDPLLVSDPALHEQDVVA